MEVSDEELATMTGMAAMEQLSITIPLRNINLGGIYVTVLADCLPTLDERLELTFKLLHWLKEELSMGNSTAINARYIQDLVDSNKGIVGVALCPTCKKWFLVTAKVLLDDSNDDGMGNMEIVCDNPGVRHHTDICSAAVFHILNEESKDTSKNVTSMQAVERGAANV